MKLLITLLFIISIWEVHAQVTFYASLSRVFKRSVNEIQLTSQGQITQAEDYIVFPDFSIFQPAKSFSQPKRISIDVGMAYKKHRLSSGILTDNVSSEYILTFRNYDPVSGKYKDNSMSGTSKSSQSRFFINYDYIIFNRNRKTNFFLSSSIGLCYRAGPKGIGPVGSIGAGANLDGAHKILSLTSSAFTANRKYAFNWGIGLGTDLFYKGHYLFTLNTNISFSNKSLYFEENTIVVSDINTTPKTYDFVINNNCAGLYFGISRRFQFYPWKPIKEHPIWDHFHPLEQD